MELRSITSVRRNPEPIVASRRRMRLRAEATAFALALLSAVGLSDQIVVREAARNPKLRSRGPDATHEVPCRALALERDSPSDGCF